MSLEITANELNSFLMGTLSERIGKSQKRNRHSRSPTKPKRLKLDTTPPSDEIPSSSDSKLNEEVVKRIANKNKRTLLLSGLPPKTTTHIMEALIPDAHTSRIQWNSLTHTCTGVVYVEFDNEDLVEVYKKQLDGTSFQNRTLCAKTGRFLPEAADQYDLSTLVLHGLHHKTHVGEIAKRFPSATSIKLSSIHKRSDKQRPVLAFLTFPSSQDALIAFDTRQHVMIRRRRFNISWLLRKAEQHPQIFSRKCLFVRGLRKAVTETDLQTVFPQATSITMKPNGGTAFLHYDLEEDCVVDYQNARHLKLHDRKIHVAFCKTTASLKNVDGSVQSTTKQPLESLQNAVKSSTSTNNLKSTSKRHPTKAAPSAQKSKTVKNRSKLLNNKSAK